ncbi:hypothetical protein ECANGB1_381 [Enterospora canceri]|uniref:Uncharacterized protein n=1 Tax=Enterospora canceri TaxID=1081671 RepID=A0A1Y1S838_9MICR|nr:hypothetical protein ECANGB1_381 [Enterospora canceri]
MLSIFIDIITALPITITVTKPYHVNQYVIQFRVNDIDISSRRSVGDGIICSKMVENGVICELIELYSVKVNVDYICLLEEDESRDDCVYWIELNKMGWSSGEITIINS